jgi:hypothetical protein
VTNLVRVDRVLPEADPEAAPDDGNGLFGNRATNENTAKSIPEIRLRFDAADMRQIAIYVAEELVRALGRCGMLPTNADLSCHRRNVWHDQEQQRRECMDLTSTGADGDSWSLDREANRTLSRIRRKRKRSGTSGR